MADLETLPEPRQQEIAEWLEQMIWSERAEYQLTPEQLADLERRVANPGPFATDEEVEAFFADCKEDN